MAIIIKKKVTLEFLGEEYKEAYLLFKSIPIKDYKEIMQAQTDDNLKALEFITKTLQKYHLGGKFPDENNQLSDVKNEEIADFDAETITHCFEVLTGQTTDEEGNRTVDPLSPNESDKPSSTAQNGPTS